MVTPLCVIIRLLLLKPPPRILHGVYSLFQSVSTALLVVNLVCYLRVFPKKQKLSFNFSLLNSTTYEITKHSKFIGHLNCYPKEQITQYFLFSVNPLLPTHQKWRVRNFFGYHFSSSIFFIKCVQLQNRGILFNFTFKGMKLKILKTKILEPF